jgi:hypothetical protein
VSTLAAVGGRRPRYGPHFRAYVVGGHAAYVKEKLVPKLKAVFDIDVIKHADWDHQAEWSRPIPDDVDVVLIITDMISTPGHAVAADQARRRNYPFVRTTHKWTDVYLKVKQAGFQELSIKEALEPGLDAAKELVNQHVRGRLQPSAVAPRCKKCGIPNANPADSLCDQCAETELHVMYAREQKLLDARKEHERLKASAVPPPLKEPKIKQPEPKEEKVPHQPTAAEYANIAHRPKGKRICASDTCGKEYEFWRKDQKYCSEVCKSRQVQREIRAKQRAAASEKKEEQVVKSNEVQVPLAPGDHVDVRPFGLINPPPTQPESTMALIRKLRAAMKEEGLSEVHITKDGQALDVRWKGEE